MKLTDLRNSMHNTPDWTCKTFLRLLFRGFEQEYCCYGCVFWWPKILFYLRGSASQVKQKPKPTNERIACLKNPVSLGFRCQNVPFKIQATVGPLNNCRHWGWGGGGGVGGGRGGGLALFVSYLGKE